MNLRNTFLPSIYAHLHLNILVSNSQSPLIPFFPISSHCIQSFHRLCTATFLTPSVCVTNECCIAEQRPLGFLILSACCITPFK